MMMFFVLRGQSFLNLNAQSNAINTIVGCVCLDT